jgi:hypothetical protein
MSATEEYTMDTIFFRDVTEAVDRVWGDGVVVTRFLPLLALREDQEKIAAAHVAAHAA